MARLRDTRTGVVVNVDDDTATALGAHYESAEERAETERPRRGGRRQAVQQDED